MISFSLVDHILLIEYSLFFYIIKLIVMLITSFFIKHYEYFIVTMMSIPFGARGMRLHTQKDIMSTCFIILKAQSSSDNVISTKY